MTEAVTALLPAAIAAGVLVVAVLVTIIVVRIVRRGPGARAAAALDRRRAAVAVITLDDALDAFDLDLALSGALQGPDSPPGLRRARMNAQHARDDAFAELRAAGAAALPVTVRRAARQVQHSTGSALATLTTARHEHDAWVRGHATPVRLVTAARARLAETRAALGDPEALVRELRPYDEAEWRDAAEAARDAVAAAHEAEVELDRATALAADPGADARPALEAAERALRRAAADERVLEETHRLVVEAAKAVRGELVVTRAALHEALDARRSLRADVAERVTDEVRAAAASLARLDTEAERRPVASVREIALVRERIDLVVGEILSPQQRVRSARSALPGTLAAARASIAHAEAVLDHDADGDARMKLAAAQHDLAQARTATDVVQALAAARAAIHDADDAVAERTTNEPSKN